MLWLLLLRSTSHKYKLLYVDTHRCAIQLAIENNPNSPTTYRPQFSSISKHYSASYRHVSQPYEVASSAQFLLSKVLPSFALCLHVLYLRLVRVI